MAPCFLDLNAVDFYMWAHLKVIVYSAPFNSIETLISAL